MKRVETASSLLLVLATLGSACSLTGPNGGGLGGSWDYLPKCGGFGPPVSGLDFVGGQANTVVLGVGEERTITLVVNKPQQVVVSKDCPDRIQGASFREIEWSVQDLGVIHIGPPSGVQILSLDPPRAGYIGGWGAHPGENVTFLVRGIQPGAAWLSVSAFLGAGKAGDWALAGLSFRVR